MNLYRHKNDFLVTSNALRPFLNRFLQTIFRPSISSGLESTYSKTTKASMLNLYTIYKAYAQRVRRNPDNLELRKIKEIMKYLITQSLEENLTIEEQLDCARKIGIIESDQRNCRKLYYHDLQNALVTGNYEVEIPYQVINLWRESENSAGHVYLATSGSRKNQVKLGATTTSIWRREAAYLNRWGYEISIDWKIRTEQPLAREHIIKSKMNKYLVSGLTEGESNEWYYGNLSDFTQIIVEECEAEKKYNSR